MGIVARLEWMLGPGTRYTGITSILSSADGTSGETLHGGGLGANPFERPDSVADMRYIAAPNGRTYSPKVNVAWCLRDQLQGDGGFIVLPGSQRANLPLPCDKLDDDTIFEHTIQCEMRRGDVLIFSGGAVTHGALPWKGKSPRRQVLLSYKSAAIGTPRM